MFCVYAGVDSTGIDALFPVTEEEFGKFREALTQKISSFSVSTSHYIYIRSSSFLAHLNHLPISHRSIAFDYFCPIFDVCACLCKWVHAKM